MRKIHKLLLLLLAALLSACSGSQPETAKSSATNPSETVREFSDAVRRKDYETVKKLFSKKTVAELERNSSVKTFVDEARGFDRGVPETRNEKIDGDKATIEVKDPTREGEEKWTLLKFIKEDGIWKITRSGE